MRELSIIYPVITLIWFVLSFITQGPERKYLLSGPFWDGFRKGSVWFIVPLALVTGFNIYNALIGR